MDSPSGQCLLPMACTSLRVSLRISLEGSSPTFTPYEVPSLTSSFLPISALLRFLVLFNHSHMGLGEEALLSVDAYCIPGSEGGGIFDAANGALIGLLVPPVRRRDGTATLNIALPISPILGDLARIVPTLSGSAVSMNKGTDEATAVVAEALRSLVLISLSSMWASGVIISPQGCASNPYLALALILRSVLPSLTHC